MERGSCCLGLLPCSSTQNMALCSAHESLWHCEQNWRWGVGVGGRSAGQQRVAGRGAAGCQSSHCSQAHKHERGHTHASKYKCLTKKINNSFWRCSSKSVTRTEMLQGRNYSHCKKLSVWEINGHEWTRLDWTQKPNLPQHCSDDCPRHQPSQAQVQSEKASSHSCSHTQTYTWGFHSHHS